MSVFHWTFGAIWDNLIQWTETTDNICDTVIMVTKMFLLTVVFFLLRVCVKKSTQERLALKILIDRPKARNEVRGNICHGGD